VKRPDGFDTPKQPPKPQEAPRAARKPRAVREKPTAPVKKPRVDRPSTGRAKKELRAAARERRRYEKSEIRRFTRRSRHRRLGLLIGLGVAAVLAGLLAVAVYSPLLALRTITVDGTSRVSAGEVRAAIDGQLGTPLALLDYDALRTELDRFPLIRSFVTEIVPPGTLRVHIVERAPVAAIAAATGYSVVDPAGVVLESSAQRPAGVPLIDIGASGTDSVAFRAVVDVLLALPDSLRTRVETASAQSKDDVRLVLAGVGQRIVWGSAERSALKARVLQELIATQSASAHVEYDVSAPLSPVVRPR
jgi:cell division protein FtsQ